MAGPEHAGHKRWSIYSERLRMVQHLYGADAGRSVGYCGAHCCNLVNTTEPSMSNYCDHLFFVISGLLRHCFVTYIVQMSGGGGVLWISGIVKYIDV